MLNIGKLKDAHLNTDPFEYLVLEDFIESNALKDAIRDYPVVPGPGSHPPSKLEITGKTKELIYDHLLGDEFRKVIENKFDVDLTDRPTMFTIRGYCQAKDGQIHTDSKTKIITVLLYMNDAEWPSDTGRLRLLNNGDNLEDYFEEIEPKGGTILIFKRSDNSWHGHQSFEGQRRAIQLNWVTDAAVVAREQRRHGFSSFLKKAFARG